MKYNFVFLFFLCFSLALSAQDFSGQWKGEFTDKSTSFQDFGGDQCDYVLDLECTGDSVTGSSYTYFTDGGKKYYTICRLQGFIKRKQQYIEVKEVERTKTNVPDKIRNCFQVHKLTYFKEGDSTTLQGNWIPAPDQNGDCGYGTTLLARRELKSILPNYKTAVSGTSLSKKISVANKKSLSKPFHKAASPVAKKTAAKPGMLTKKGTIKKPLAVNNAKINTPGNIQPSLSKPDHDSVKKEMPLIPESLNPPLTNERDTVMSPPIKFEKRNNTVLQTIEVKNKIVRVDLYDNGEVDGDSISLFYNGKLLMSSKRLSEKPITLNITVEDDMVNELVMYAENLGTIPPNTALMVVTDGHKRYEVRITSDLEKSGVINFVHKPSQD